MLELKNVTKRFSGLVAVDNVSLKIATGEMVGIVGPNGSGKTTLYNLISGIYSPDSGKIFFDDQEITRLPAYTRANLGIGRTFQIPRPFHSITVRENVAMGAIFGANIRKIGVDEAMSLADGYIDLLGITAVQHKLAKNLTSSEKKLVEIARALAMKPRLLLLDEVMAGMDPGDIDNLVKLLKNISQRENIALIAMVEHIMRAVTSFAERVIVMYRGSILCDAPTREALADPRVLECYIGKRRC